MLTDKEKKDLLDFAMQRDDGLGLFRGLRNAMLFVVLGTMLVWGSCIALSGERSSRWATVRANHLKYEPVCVLCLSTKDPEVHHVQPFSVNPDLELVETNLITLCASGPNHHLHFGHFGNYQYYNPHVREDVERTRREIEERGER